MAFATSDDVATRLARELSSAETSAADFLLDAVAAEIAQAVDTAEGDITDPGMLRFISVEAVCRALANPSGATSTSETVGSYNYAVSFPANEGDGLLTPYEEGVARYAVHGTNSASVHLGSILESE